MSKINEILNKIINEKTPGSTINLYCVLLDGYVDDLKNFKKILLNTTVPLEKVASNKDIDKRVDNIGKEIDAMKDTLQEMDDETYTKIMSVD